MFERRAEYFVHSHVGDGQLGAADGVGGNLVGVVDEGDGIAAENEVLGHVDVRMVQVAIVVERLHRGEASPLLEGFQKKGFQLYLKTVDEDILCGQLSAGLGVEVHDDLLVDGMVAAFSVIDVGQIDQCSLAASLCVAVDDIVVVVPRLLMGGVIVLVVERLQHLDVVVGIIRSKSLGRLLHVVIVMAHQAFCNGGVDDLAGSPALGGGLFKADVHAAHRREAVGGDGNGLVDRDSLKSDRLNFLTAGTEQQDKNRGVEQSHIHKSLNQVQKYT